ncbi:MAG TPA: hypothetical protein VM324_03805 [Egibacteraceae bacterium]|nr:hypothetical protein [Egibacteraceae bacterium]
MSAAPESSPVNRKLLAVLGVIVVAAGAFQFVVKPLLLSDADGGQAVELPVRAPADPAPVAEGEDPDDERQPEDAALTGVRDPFEQLVTAAAPAPVAAPAPATAPAADATSGGGGPQDSVRLVAVTPDDAGLPHAHLAVNGTPHVAAVGAAFAERFRVVDIQEQCVTLEAGDERFALCAGEEIRR